MILEGARLLKLHSSASDASGLAHQEMNHAGVSYSSQFVKTQEQVQVW